MWMNRGRNNRNQRKISHSEEKKETSFRLWHKRQQNKEYKTSRNQTIMIWMEKMWPANSNRASVYAHVHKIYYKLFFFFYFCWYWKRIFFSCVNCKPTQATCLFRSAIFFIFILFGCILCVCFILSSFFSINICIKKTMEKYLEFQF